MRVANDEHVGGPLAYPHLRARKPRLGLARIWLKTGRAAYISSQSDVLRHRPGTGRGGKHGAQRENADCNNNWVRRFSNHGISSGLLFLPTTRIACESENWLHATFALCKSPE